MPLRRSTSHVRYLAVATLVTLASASAFTLAGCGGPTTTVHKGAPVRASAKWVLLPVQNHSETPQAGERVEAMLETLLRRGGIARLEMYPPPKEDDTHLLTSDRQRYESAIEWARGKYDYGVTGSVEEWRYKNGLDGEPAIGLSMRVVDLSSGAVVWAATGTQTGGGGDNASGTALKLLTALVRELDRTQ